MILEGIVTRGLGKAAAYLLKPYYKQAVKKKLGFEPYPGTLNIKTSKDYSLLLREKSSLRIQGFKEKDKKYIGANCHEIRISGLKAAIIIPDITEHPKTILEIISGFNLKKKLNLKDGDKVKIELL